jgi:pimeloyl-ACP methyl ester carboxylesterase
MTSGPPSELGLYADAEAALTEIGRRGFNADRVALWGHSLGSAVASEMATRGRGSSLVLIAPFTSVPDVARRFAPLLPMSALFSDRYDNLAKAPRIRVPTVIIHGDDDSEIPIREGRTLSSAILGARFMVIPGAGHVDVFDRGGLALFDAGFSVARRP